ncbi:MAG TPA: hypothetical protein VH309_04845 [Elusimicrobiota bacterium]|nr:hypothetical protein [Elusimicrobiota bacterium]
MMEQHNTPLTKEILTEALLGLEERLDAKWELKLDSKLQRFATKDDLQRFATKDDLQRFATKDDLQPFAKTEDVKILQDEIRRVAVTVARLEGDMNDVKHILKTEVATKKEFDVVMRYADRTLNEMDVHRELRSTRGALLGDVVEKVADHERRLRGIEGRD